MGKKAKFKKIRQLAAQLPVITTKHIIGESVRGHEIKEAKDAEGKPIQLDKTYRKKTVVEQPLNHNRQMKDMYNRFGLRGVKSYVDAVKHLTTQ